MPLFSPPVTASFQWVSPDNSRPTADRLFSYYDGPETGITVWKDGEGNWQQGQYPYQGGGRHRTFVNGVLESDATVDGLADAELVFYGGHVYEISDALAAELTAEGYGERINIVSPITATWAEDELAHFFNQVMTVDPPNIPADMALDGLATDLRLASGDVDFSSRRDFWLHEHTSGWTDVRVVCEGFDPLVFDAGHSIGQVLPQGGACLRFQFDGTKNRAVTINNNIFLGVPYLNIGVWEALPDGTSFANRQTSITDVPSLPYGFEVILEGNVVQARVWPMQEAPPPWDHPTRALTADLDTEAGDAVAIPTPTGEGTQGVIQAHTGTHRLSAVRLHKTVWERLS